MPPLLNRQWCLHVTACTRCFRLKPSVPTASLRTGSRPPSHLSNLGDFETSKAFNSRQTSVQDSSYPSKRRRVSGTSSRNQRQHAASINADSDGGVIRDTTDPRDIPVTTEPLLEALPIITDKDLDAFFQDLKTHDEQGLSAGEQGWRPRNLKDDLLSELNATSNEWRAIHISPNGAVPRQSRVLLSRLNDSLRDSAKEPQNTKYRRELWRWYDRSKPNVPGLLQMISRDAWDLLWSVQAVISSANPDRLVNLATIAEDMMLAGWTLSEEQRMLLIEGLSVKKNVKAVQMWEEVFHQYRHITRFLELGLRIHTQMLHRERAEQILEDLLAQHPQSDARNVASVVYLLASTGEAEDLSKSWRLYERLRLHKGSSITMADYDMISLIFLDLGHKDNALAVFRDMMLDKNVWHNANDSTAQARAAAFSRAEKQSFEITNTKPDEISYLPKSLQNRFFYASWLRKLISEAKLNEAALVFDLMNERGIRPDAHHMNGFIHALFRTGDDSARENAEKLGWAMIQTRLDSLRHRHLRRTGNDVKGVSIWDAPAGITIPHMGHRRVPPASSETFSLLVEHYVEKQMMVHVRHLRDLMPAARLKMNSFTMNHLLLAELRNRGFPYVWARFNVMARDVRPDMQTYKMLWEALKQHMLAIDRRDALTGLPTPRQLFARMMSDFRRLSARDREYAREHLDLATYNDIIRCFFRLRDIEGAFVSIQVAKTTLSLYPVHESLTMIIRQVSRIDGCYTQPRQLHKSLVVAKQSRNEEAASLTFTNIAEQRVQQLRKANRVWDDLDPLQKAEEGQRTVLALLKSVAKMRQKSTGAVDFQVAITETCRDMELEDINVEMALLPVPEHVVNIDDANQDFSVLEAGSLS